MQILFAIAGMIFFSILVVNTLMRILGLSKKGFLSDHEKTYLLILTAVFVIITKTEQVKNEIIEKIEEKSLIKTEQTTIEKE